MSIIDSKDFTKENVDYVMNFAVEKGGLDYAAKKMDEFKNKAINELADFATGEVKDALVRCAEFAAARKI